MTVRSVCFQLGMVALYVVCDAITHFIALALKVGLQSGKRAVPSADLMFVDSSTEFRAFENL